MNDPGAHHNQGQDNNYADEESRYAPEPMVGEHNCTISNYSRSWLCSPLAMRDYISNDGLKNHNDAMEPISKAEASDKWVPNNKPALEAVNEQPGPKHNTIQENIGVKNMSQQILNSPLGCHNT